MATGVGGSWLCRFLLPVLVIVGSAHDVRSHSEGHGEPIQLTLVGAERRVDGNVEIAFEIRNVGPYAATLRDATTSGAQRVTISRIRHLMGLDVANPIDHLRLEPGQIEYLAPPDYQVLVEGLAADTKLLKVDLDFGPLGIKSLPVTIQP